MEIGGHAMYIVSRPQHRPVTMRWIDTSGWCDPSDRLQVRLHRITAHRRLFVMNPTERDESMGDSITGPLDIIIALLVLCAPALVIAVPLIVAVILYRLLRHRQGRDVARVD